MVIQHRMGVLFWACVTAALWLGGSSPVLAQAPDPAKIEYRVEKLGDNLFALFGAGGNIAVLTGPDGHIGTYRKVHVHPLESIVWRHGRAT